MINIVKYYVFSDTNDYYLSDCIVRYLTNKKLDCHFFYDDLTKLNSINDTQDIHNKIILVANQSLIDKENVVNDLQTFSFKNGYEIIIIQSDFDVEYPNSWGTIRYIDGTLGLNDEILNTLTGSTDTPVGQVINMYEIAKEEANKLEQKRKEAEENARRAEEERLKVEEENKKIFLRVIGPSTLEDTILEGLEISPTLNKGIKYLLGDGLPQDGERAFNILKKYAFENSQDPLASYYLGVCYNVGFSNLDQDASSREMKISYEKAANYGIDKAIITLGLIYLQEGQLDEAKKLFQKLLNENNPVGFYYLGYLEEQNRNYTSAIDLYYEAAENGVSEAQNGLGCLFGEGLGCKKDLDKASQWFNLAYQQGLSVSKINLAYIYTYYSNGKRTEEGVSMLEEEASKGNEKASFFLKEIYREIERKRKEEERRIRNQ